jgi:hypothetical protein
MLPRIAYRLMASHGDGAFGYTLAYPGAGFDPNNA